MRVNPILDWSYRYSFTICSVLYFLYFWQMVRAVREKVHFYSKSAFLSFSIWLEESSSLHDNQNGALKVFLIPYICQIPSASERIIPNFLPKFHAKIDPFALD